MSNRSVHFILPAKATCWRLIAEYSRSMSRGQYHRARVPQYRNDWPRESEPATRLQSPARRSLRLGLYPEDGPGYDCIRHRFQVREIALLLDVDFIPVYQSNPPVDKPSLT